MNSDLHKSVAGKELQIDVGLEGASVTHNPTHLASKQDATTQLVNALKDFQSSLSESDIQQLLSLIERFPLMSESTKTIVADLECRTTCQQS